VLLRDCPYTSCRTLERIHRVERWGVVGTFSEWRREDSLFAPKRLVQMTLCQSTRMYFAESAASQLRNASNDRRKVGVHDVVGGCM